ncbi:MAG: type II CRISPR RNA-guided endonuclease Cas9 [Thermoanaerobaculia bacterium]
MGLDVGVNSLGWCVYSLDEDGEPASIRRMGVRIFSDGRNPKDLASKAADRRLARQMRRRRDRVLKRRRRLIDGLVKFGLLPSDPVERKALQNLDPWVLRERGLDQALAPFELGRAIFHLARKRGFRSSRKESKDPESVKESGKVHAAIAALRSRVSDAGCRTVGEYLSRQHASRQPVRARRAPDGHYVLYLQRAMVAEEFDLLWAAQRQYHAELLTEEARTFLRDTILFQRRLLPARPGRCLFETDEPRARLCSPLQQRFRILQELNNLRVREGIGQRPLTLEERDAMARRLGSAPGIVTFSQLAKAAGFRNAGAFNFGNDPKRRGLKGDIVASSFSAQSALGEAWGGFSPALQQGLAVLVEQAENEESLVAALVALPKNLAPARAILGKQEDADAVLAGLRELPAPIEPSAARVLARTDLPDDYGSLSLKALTRILPELEREVVTYDVAVQRAGYTHHSQFYEGVLHDSLPYYGEVLRGYTSPADKARAAVEREFGKISNPTVHIGLNQIRQLVNALIRRYGHPAQIVIELAREFGASGEKRREITKRQADNQETNRRYDAELASLGVRANHENRLRLRLWEELGKEDALDRYCVYSGKRLSKASLFSDEVEIDHILPFSKSLHDGVGNKILCTRQSNRDKGNRTPFEAFGHSDRWPEIEERASRLPAHKALLFREEALESFLQGKDFLDRHLTDTAYLGRATKQYLTAICPPDRIWVSSGRLTGLLRARWGLNLLLSEDSKKNRNDHRHHALDAAVIGLCSRSVIQRLATAAARAEAGGETRLLERLELPWQGFREELQSTLQKIVVSHKPEHGREGALHNDTNYGLRGAPDGSGNPLVGRHVPLETLKSAADAESIPDESLREELTRALTGISGTKEVKAALAAFSARTGIRRIIKEERLAVIPIHDRRTGKAYRYVKGDGNHCYDIFRRKDGGWAGEVISIFEANRKDFNPSSHVAQNGLPLIMRIHKEDVLCVELEAGARLMRVAKFSSGVIALVNLNEANVDARTRSSSDGLKYFFKSPSALQPLRARLVGVDILGYVNDPGPKD